MRKRGHRQRTGIQQLTSKPVIPGGFEKFREREWSTMDMRVIKIKDLTDKHLANIINWVKNSNNAYPDWVKFGLKEEAKHRKLAKSFLRGAPYPWRDERTLDLLRQDKFQTGVLQVTIST